VSRGDAGGEATPPRIRDLRTLLEATSSGDLWHGGATALGSLRGVSCEAAAWKPAPERHSIWELALHIAYWKYAVRRRLRGDPSGGFGRSPANWPDVPEPRDEESWAADRRLLRAEHERLIEAVRVFDPRRLDKSAGGKKRWTYADLLYGIVLHDAYHAGQIQLMKRLHASQGTGA